MSELSEADRYPNLGPDGRRLLAWLAEHPHAPHFRNRSGHRLLPDEVTTAVEFEQRVSLATLPAIVAPPVARVDDFLRRALRQVPFYRAWGFAAVPPLEELPTTARADLARDPARFVPDDLPLDRLICFLTSGTTGHPLRVPSHPRVAAAYAAFHRRSLARRGVVLRGGPDRVGVVLVGVQRRCFTYTSVNPTMGESGLVKLNLDPGDWRHPDDRRRYLEALAPELVTGDPLSLAALAELGPAIRPAAMLSTSMASSPAQRERLSAQFGCPVVDVYSMNEAGPIAASRPDRPGHELLQPDLLVEILDARGQRLPLGERGEVTLTGGFNPYLPLVRYRTGDHAALQADRDGQLWLDGLIGRPPVRFRTRSGEWLNNLEVTHTLQEFGLPQFALHQGADAALTLRIARCGADPAALRTKLLGLFGGDQTLDVLVGFEVDDKVVQYQSDLVGAAP